MTTYTTKTSNIKKRKKISYLPKGVHEVIGQEFNNVLVPIDCHFYYNEDNELGSKYIKYYPYFEKRRAILSSYKNKREIRTDNNR